MKDRGIILSFLGRSYDEPLLGIINTRLIGSLVKDYSYQGHSVSLPSVFGFNICLKDIHEG